MMYEWAKSMNCNVTVCDTEGKIIFMNEKSIAMYGNIIGNNLFKCHNPHSQEKIKELLATGGTNIYTIEKNGIKKMIYQTAWFEDGVVGGLTEITFEIPEEMPHFIR